MPDGAGDLDKRVTLWEPKPAQDSGGFEVQGESEVRSLWANIRAVSGNESVRGIQMEAGVTTLVRIWFPKTFEVTPQHWFTHGTRKLNIVRAYDETGKRIWLDCQCRENV